MTFGCSDQAGYTLLMEREPLWLIYLPELTR
jgi:hypothetical protein